MTKEQEYNRAYYQANKERIKARNAAWAKANPDKTAGYKQKWDDAHPEAVREYWRKAGRKKRANWTQADRDLYNEKRRVSRKKYAVKELEGIRRHKESLREFITRRAA